MVPISRLFFLLIVALLAFVPFATAETAYYVAPREPLLGDVEPACGGAASAGGRNYSVGGAAFCVANPTRMAVSVVDQSGLPVVFHLRFEDATGAEIDTSMGFCGGLMFLVVPDGTTRIEVILNADPTASDDVLICPGVPTYGRIHLSAA